MTQTKYTSFRPVIRSRHPSHADLRSKNGKILPLLPFKSLIRFGSKTEMKDTIANGGDRIELNTVNGISNSSNKLLMKLCFEQSQVKTAEWCIADETNSVQSIIDRVDNFGYPVISKHVYGSRGIGNKKHDTIEELQTWLESKNDLSKYIFEKFHNYNREYRLHVTENGYFYACRKMLKSNTKDSKRWYRNNDNSVWLLEDNDTFDKPVNWNNIVEECVKALKAVGLDFGAIDLRIQSATNKKDEKRKNPKFIIIEINSAPSFGDITKQKYIEELPKILKQKWEQLKKNQ